MFAILAWANGRRYAWARVLFAVWVGLHTLALVPDIAQGLAFSGPVGAVIGAVAFWLIEVSALVLILSEQSGADYRRKPARL